MWDINRKGSVSLEAALILPAIISLILFMIGSIRIFLLYNCVSEAMYKTADFAMTYGIIYYKNGIANLENTISEKIGNKFNINNILRYGDDLLYKTAFEEYFSNELSKNKIYNKIFGQDVSWDFTGSSFFNGNEELYLTGFFMYKLNIPIFDNIYDGFGFRKNVSVRVFLNGVTILPSERSEVSVWSLSNFERGQKIQDVFGRNLPDFFPVIDIFDKGKVKMIVSIDHTSGTYSHIHNFEYRLNEKLNQLRDFDGGEYGNTTVNEILSKELILVFPENEFSPEQENTLSSFCNSANRNNIKVSVERYQYTD